MKFEPFNMNNHGLGGFDYFMGMQDMERAEAIDRICQNARSMWMHGTDPNDYIEELFSNEGIDIDSLTDEEIRKINSACR